MKTLLFICLAVFFLSITSVYAQKRKDITKAPYLVITFDCATDQSYYEGQISDQNGKSYFLVKDNTQPVIKIDNLPLNSAMITINEEYIDISPEVENTIAEVDSDNDSTGVNHIQTMGMVDSDEVIYIITIRDSEGNKLDSTTVFAKVYGKFKMDLSTGVLFHNLIDESYYYSESQNDQSSISKESSNGNIKPLFPVVLTHFYWQSRGFINPAFSLGLGIDDSGKAGYYLGPSLIIGNRQRAIFSLGLALRPTEVLKGKYTVGQLFEQDNLPDVTDLVESIYKTGVFFSITYNLTSKVEKR